MAHTFFAYIKGISTKVTEIEEITTKFGTKRTKKDITFKLQRSFYNKHIYIKIF